jgi:hypothetical protein
MVRMARAYSTHVSGRRRRVSGLRLLAAAPIAVLVGGYQEH